ncbi:MAG: hypothetical protein OHK0021_02120 [Bryobacter sp.]
MNKKLALLIACGVIAFIAFLIVSTASYSHHRVEICMDFEGHSNCATALGSTREAAYRSAVDTACATISSGMTQTIACSNTRPKSVKWLEK